MMYIFAHHLNEELPAQIIKNFWQKLAPLCANNLSLESFMAKINQNKMPKTPYKKDAVIYAANDRSDSVYFWCIPDQCRLKPKTAWCLANSVRVSCLARLAL